MLEHRPLAQKALVAIGAFMFVFTAAMAGTGFMITGGFGFDDDNNPTVRAPDHGYERAFANAPPEEVRYVEAAWTQARPLNDSAPLETWPTPAPRRETALAGQPQARAEEFSHSAEIPADGDAYAIADETFSDDAYAPSAEEIVASKIADDAY